MGATDSEADVLQALAATLEDGRDRLQACLHLARAATLPSAPLRRGYRARLDRLDREVREAEAAGDLAALVRAVRDREQLFAELGALLHGLGRTAPDQRQPSRTERAEPVTST